MLEAAVEPVFSLIIRALGWIFLEVLFQICIRGLGFIICRPFSRVKLEDPICAWFGFLGWIAILITAFIVLS